MEKGNLEVEMFGGVVEIKTTTGLQPELGDLLAPFEKSDAVIHSFCTACGFTSAVNRELAEQLAQKAKTDLPPEPAQYYFETDGCAVCKKPQGEVALKEIKKD